MRTTNTNQDSIELLCNHCGKTFSAFLHQMADQNAKVVCPSCEKDDCRPVKATETAGARRSVKKII